MSAFDPLALPLSGTRLIEASAGTGKTHTITTLFVRLLLERGRAVSEVLVVTYTRAATAELRERIRDRLSACLRASDALASGAGLDESDALARWLQERAAEGKLADDRRRLREALRDFDEAPVFTIHAFCQRVLVEWALESEAPFDLEVVGDERPLLREVVLDYWAKVAYPADPADLEHLLRNGVGPDSLLQLARRAAPFHKLALAQDPAAEALAGGAADAEAAALDARFMALRDRAASAWQGQRAEALGELTAPGRLKRNTHKPEKLQEWARELDRLSEALPGCAPDAVHRLCPAALAQATRKGETVPSHPCFDALGALVDVDEELRRRKRARVAAVRRRALEYVRDELAARKRKRRAQSFDDLLHRLERALFGELGERLVCALVARYPAALIDEFQDTDPLQYAIFRRLYAGDATSLFLIGDPKQAIYGFRGADVFAYMRAAAEAAERRHTLSVNYRSDPPLIAAVNRLFGRVPRPFLFEEIAFGAVSPRPGAREELSGGPSDDAALTLLFLARDAAQAGKPITKTAGEERVPHCIAAEIGRLLASGMKVRGEPVAARHIAVLCRTNRQGRALQAALSAAGLPTVLDGDSSVFDSEMAVEMERVLAALVEPGDLRRVAAALSTSLFGAGPRELDALQHDDAVLSLWLERFAAWNRVLRERGFVQAASRMLDEIDGHQRLLSLVDGERRITDLLHLVELLHEVAMRQHLGPQALLHWLGQLRADARAGGALAPEAVQLRLEHDERAIRLTTIHRSKGLEYPIVYCPFLWTPFSPASDALFHDPQREQRLTLDLGSPELERHRRRADQEELSEALRMLYVAVTRAEHRCYIVCGGFRRLGASALGYLLHRGGHVAEDDFSPALDRRLSKAEDAELERDLCALCEPPGCIAVRHIVSEADEPKAARRRPEAPELAARAFGGKLAVEHRLSSFSRLTREAVVELGPDADDGIDHDVDQPDVEALVGERADAPRLALHEFPAGPHAGSLVHAVLENIDFTDTAEAGWRGEVERQLSLHGLSSQRHADALTRALGKVLRTRLSGVPSAPALAEVAREDRLDELEFTFPVSPGGGPLAPARLAEVFARHAAPSAAPAYAQRLSRLGFAPFHGFLKGYIDLVFRSGGRYFLVDYKTNWLGDVASAYGAGAMRAAMSEHHYFLQYHLYVLALHRYLRLRHVGYDYERDFGGVFYLFLRGMAPEHERGTGVFCDRPSLSLLDELDRLIAGDLR